MQHGKTAATNTQICQCIFLHQHLVCILNWGSCLYFWYIFFLILCTPSLCLLERIFYVFSNKIILVWFQIPVSFVLLSFVLLNTQRDLFIYSDLSKSVGERAKMLFPWLTSAVTYTAPPPQAVGCCWFEVWSTQLHTPQQQSMLPTTVLISTPRRDSWHGQRNPFSHQSYPMG